MRYTFLKLRTGKSLFGQDKSNRGFTLIEIAVSLMVIGLLITPAIAAYNLYLKQQKVEHTRLSLDNSSTFIAGFLQEYGRYPCPAPMDADIGDPEYGYEDCSATAPGIITAQSTRTPPLANPNVLIGSIPFRTLNLDQDDAVDGYHSRLTYAVTEELTDSDTYFVNLGGIGVLSNATSGADSAISPENSAHFLILSHGENGVGAIVETGTPAGNCASGSALEQENCDYLTDATPEATFLSTHKQNDFDDVVSYYMGSGVTPWQYQDTNTDDIHLRRGDTVVSGVAGLMTSPTSAFSPENIHIRDEDPDPNNTGPDSDGIMLVRGDAGGTSPPTDHTGTVRADRLCGGAGTNDECFSPEILYGGVVTSTGDLETITGPLISAGNDSNGDPLTYGAEGSNGGIACVNNEIMIGIEEGTTLCAKTIEFNCPPGNYVKGLDSNGQIICDGSSPAGCPAQTGLTNSCGGTFDLPAKPHNGTHHTHSGTCHEIEDFDDSYADSLMVPGNFALSLANIQNYVDDLNAGKRTVTACDSYSNGLVRDTYECNDGSWMENASGDIIPDDTNERGEHIWGWTNYRDAETLSHPGYIPYPAWPADPMSVHSDNDNGYHDCWCREDYRVQVETCDEGTGQRISVEIHPCPQTYSEWDPEWISDASLTCTCVPAPNLTEPWGSCEEYYSDISGTTVPAGSMDGDVERIYDLQCPGYVEAEHPMSTWDTNSCTCPNESDEVPDPSPDACPTGFTNSGFTFEGETYPAGTHKVEHDRWICPLGKGNQVSAANHHGYSDITSHTEPCICDPTVTDTTSKSCEDINPEWTGTPLTYKMEMDCSATPPKFVESDPPELLSGQCSACKWEPQGATPTASNLSLPGSSIFEDDSCNCNAGLTSQPCAVRSGATWQTWSCSCVNGPVLLSP